MPRRYISFAACDLTHRHVGLHTSVAAMPTLRTRCGTVSGHLQFTVCLERCPHAGPDKALCPICNVVWQFTED